MIARLRYNVNDKVIGDQEPAILLYQLRTDLFIRFVLLLIVLLESSQLFTLLSHYTTSIRSILFLIFILGFVSPTTAILSSALAIYLTLSKIFNHGNYAIMATLLFALCSLSSLSGRLPLTTPFLISFAFCLYVTFKHLK